jgi:signal transduction histidine kinase
MDPEVERAAYFTCTEALANVIKHARTGQATVSLRVTDGRLLVDVSDLGSGDADPEGSGLVGLADRLAAVGGTLRVLSHVGQGTVLTADLPAQPILRHSFTP